MPFTSLYIENSYGNYHANVYYYLEDEDTNEFDAYPVFEDGTGEQSHYNIEQLDNVVAAFWQELQETGKFSDLACDTQNDSTQKLLPL